MIDLQIILADSVVMRVVLDLNDPIVFWGPSCIYDDLGIIISLPGPMWAAKLMSQQSVIPVCFVQY